MAAELTGSRFYKMSGSGNDFVFFDGRGGVPGVETPAVVQALCARGTGIGADGVVVLDKEGDEVVAIRYYNSDGSRADLCGNATLCTVNLAARLGLVSASGFHVRTDAGLLAARVRDGHPEFDLPEITDVVPDYEAIGVEGSESRLGFATAGVPHVVIRVPDCQSVDVVSRGRKVRGDASLEHGANVNFVSRGASGWRMRTYERGVEAETLACGTGSVATAVMLREWGAEAGDVVLATSSGRSLAIRLSRTGRGWQGSLSGEGRLVFVGELGSL